MCGSRTRLDNPVTRDRLEILNSPLNGDAGPLVFRSILAPRAAGSPLHVHRAIRETFEVEAGLLRVTVGDKTQLLGPAERVEIAPGVAHAFSNATNEPTRFLATCSPGEGFERFLLTMFSAAEAGETDAEGTPNDPRVLALAIDYADLVLANLPRAPQAALFGLLAWWGRLGGVERRLERRWASSSAEALA